MKKITPVILSGGSGTRLWPVSRQLNPKQFLDFFGNNTLFEQSALRVNDSKLFNSPVIICNNEHRFIVAESLQKIAIKPQAILLEPIGRNTAPAIAIAALNVAEVHKKNDDLILVMPSDHVITDEKKFIAAIENAAKIASDNYLVTFGIVPNKPETGYGYIKKSQALSNHSGGFNVEKFVEKPKKELAEEFLKDGSYLWNSGIFMFSAAHYLEVLQKFENEIYHNSNESYRNAVKDLDFIRLNSADFEKCANISIDYAVMEKSDKVAVVPMDAGWSDVGSWQAVAEITPQDSHQNSLLGDVATIQTKNCYINAGRGLVATIGVENLIIIALKDVILVINKNNAQDVKKMYEMLQQKGREECKTHTKVLRPWGSFETIDLAERFKVKKITVKPGASLSLQMHHHRAEHWIVVKGTAHVTRGDEEFIITEDQSTYIQLGQRHRLENKGQIPLEVIEVQTGGYLGEDDIVRFSDVYGR